MTTNMGSSMCQKYLPKTYWLATLATSFRSFQRLESLWECLKPFKNGYFVQRDRGGYLPYLGKLYGNFIRHYFYLNFIWNPRCSPNTNWTKRVIISESYKCPRKSPPVMAQSSNECFRADKLRLNGLFIAKGKASPLYGNIEIPIWEINHSNIK